MRRARSAAAVLAALAGVAADSVRAALATPADTAATITRPAEWDTLHAGLPEAAQLNLLVGFRYNRVDGPAPGVGLGFLTGDSPVPILYATYRHAFSRERGLFDAGFEERVGRRPLLALGGSVYRTTATDDAWIVGENENTAFALLARTDYRDH